MGLRLLTRGLGIVAMAAMLGACAGSGFGLSQRNPDSLYGNYLAARHAGTVRDMDAAARYYAQALSEDPGNPVIVERAFLLSVTAGKVSDALNLTADIIERDPDNRTARLVRALSALKAEDYDRTISEIDAAAPGPFTALVGTLAKAWAVAGKQEAEQAYAALDSFQDRPAFDLFRVLHGGLIADYLGDSARARTGYIAAQEASGGASLRIIQAYGRFLETEGDRELAREVFNNYGRLAPDHPIIASALERLESGVAPAPLVKTPAEGLAEALYGLASALAQESGIDISILYTQLALYLRPDFDVARTLLADLYERGDRLEDAIATYTRIPRTSPLYQNAQIQIAIDMDRLDKSEEAVARLRTLIRQYPDAVEPLTALGDILRGRKDYAAAASEYSKAIDLIGEPNERFWTVYYARGMCYERLKLWPSAEKDLKLALELSGDHPLVLNYLGYSWIEQKIHLEEAMAMIRRAVELRPDDGYIVDSLGWAYFNIGDYENAVIHLERAVQLQPDDVTINDHLGDAFWRVGRKIEARFQWQHALELEPEEEQEIAIKEKLENGLEDADVEMSADAGS
ncbi:MAG: tetratricopeptide repeat protein [Rhodobiaceae bacterium]|nr:tetratricopeptide repeat protein [Rhodobiaceae bacterium]